MSQHSCTTWIMRERTNLQPPYDTSHCPSKWRDQDLTQQWARKYWNGAVMQNSYLTSEPTQVVSTSTDTLGKHSHTSWLYLLGCSGGHYSTIFQQRMQTCQRLPKTPCPPKHSPQESELQLFKMGWGQDCSLQWAGTQQDRRDLYGKVCPAAPILHAPIDTSTEQKAVTTYQVTSAERPHTPTHTLCRRKRDRPIWGEITRRDLLVWLQLFQQFLLQNHFIHLPLFLFPLCPRKK